MAEDVIYLTTGKDSKGRLLAIMSQGSPQHGDEHVTVLMMEVVKNQKTARQWFRQMCVERPWESRN